MISTSIRMLTTCCLTSSATFLSLREVSVITGPPASTTNGLINLNLIPSDGNRDVLRDCAMRFPLRQRTNTPTRTRAPTTPPMTALIRIRFGILALAAPAGVLEFVDVTCVVDDVCDVDPESKLTCCNSIVA